MRLGAVRRMLSVRAAWTAVGLGLLALAACGTVPRAEYVAYSEAFDGAKTAGADIYRALKPAVDARRALNGRPVPSAAPTTVAPFAASLGDGWRIAPERAVAACDGFEGYPNLQVRCEAFAFAARYNRLVSELITGDPTIDVERELGLLQQQIAPKAGTIAQLITAGASFFGPINLPIGAVPDLIQQALEADRDRDVLERLAEGLPTIREFVDLLQEDVEKIYALQRALHVIRLTEAVDGPETPTPGQIGVEAQTIQLIAAFRAARYMNAIAPQHIGDAFMAEQDAKLEKAFASSIENQEIARLDPIRRSRLGWPEAIFGPKPSVAETAELGPLAKGDLLRQMAELEISLAAFDAEVAEWRRIERSLREYATLLGELSDALDILRERVASETEFADFSIVTSLLGLDPTTPEGVDGLMALALSVNSRVASIETLLRDGPFQETAR